MNFFMLTRAKLLRKEKAIASAVKRQALKERRKDKAEKTLLAFKHYLKGLFHGNMFRAWLQVPGRSLSDQL